MTKKLTVDHERYSFSGADGAKEDLLERSSRARDRNWTKRAQRRFDRGSVTVRVDAHERPIGVKRSGATRAKRRQIRQSIEVRLDQTSLGAQLLDVGVENELPAIENTDALGRLFDLADLMRRERIVTPSAAALTI